MVSGRKNQTLILQIAMRGVTFTLEALMLKMVADDCYLFSEDHFFLFLFSQFVFKMNRLK